MNAQSCAPVHAKWQAQVAKELVHLLVSVHRTHTRKHVVGSWEETASIVVRDDLGMKMTGIYAPRGGQC